MRVTAGVSGCGQRRPVSSTRSLRQVSPGRREDLDPHQPGVGLRVLPGIQTRIQIARSLVTIHAEIRTRVAPGQGESPKFPRLCHQLYRGRGIP
ncbi:hypothetical protein ElyMa_000750200 [Elysia marginata]|uniref:Uncharacterized protein n=1 Tax=Elysia marginata TaxID=1093978 RepID=A0AAV4GRL8_9GAST|nr:hypothetical protein ElyMa_000750200 [Elysia marginata]